MTDEYELAIASIDKMIASQQRQVDALKASRRKMIQAHSVAIRGDKPFAGWKPIQAMRAVFKEFGHVMTEGEMELVITARGVTYGKKRDVRKPSSVKSSFKKNLELGNIVKVDGLIGLPEWLGKDGKFKPEYMPPESPDNSAP